MFAFAPSDQVIRWNEEGIVGAKKLVQRVSDLVDAFGDVVRAAPPGAAKPSSAAAKELRLRAHEMVRRFDAAFRGDLALNPGIAAIYELLNAFPKPADVAGWSDADRAAVAEAMRLLVKAMAPVAPHLCEELHERLGGTGSVFREPWPTFDPSALRRDEVEIAVQVNGKIRDRINVSADADEATVRAAAMILPKVAAEIAGRAPKKVIVVKGRLVNFIV
jgi:leucyl-tRNA synthetase